jgi:hypothetical protein
MNHKGYFLTFVVLLATAVSGFLVLKQKGEAQLVQNMVGTSAYFEKLKSTDLEGCSLLKVTDADMVFVGDSHTYAGIDFAHVSKAFPQLEIGACPVGGFYLDTLVHFLTYSKNAGLTPEYIVYGAAPRQFVLTDSKDKVSEQMLTGLNKRFIYDDNLFFLRDFVKAVSGRSLSEQNVILDPAHVENLSKLDPSETHVYFDRFKNKNYLEWQRQIGSWSFDPKLGESIKKICALITEMNSKLIVLHIPESPTLESMYGTELLKTYENALRSFDCADKILVADAASYGIDDRHFLNRRMVKDFPYDKIQKMEEIFSAQAYDLDHLNPVGAEVFSRKMTETLKELKPELASN